MAALIETVPKFELSGQDVELLDEELEEYHRIFSPLYQRREQRENALLYQQGLLSNCSRKSVESMVMYMVGDDPKRIRSLQTFISEGCWEDAPMLACLREEVDMALGEEDGVILLDGSDFAKQGEHSVGVKRQRCGELGKTANCQAGVFLGYASSVGYALLARRLYMPKIAWGFGISEKSLVPQDFGSRGQKQRYRPEKRGEGEFRVKYTCNPANHPPKKPKT